jgi:RNA polymerase sigma factor (sigma-70 family)
MKNDTELLRQYVEESCEKAFTELVREHLNLVYSAALREMNGDTALAEDVSQAVFTQLARKARALLSHPSLAGWLYTSVRHVAANLRRSDQHRQRREREAQSMNELLAEPSPNEAWQQIRPVLDDALHELNDADRAVLVLRFLEDRALSEVGARLGLKENTARMRAERALEKLRGLLARRGITSTASSLSAALAVGVLTPPPAALAATIAGASLASVTAAGSSTLTFIKFMSISKLKAGVIGTLVIAGTALPVWQQSRLTRIQSENEKLRSQIEIAVAPVETKGQPETKSDSAELERLREWQAKTQPELLRLRGMAGVARRANGEAEELRKQLAQQAKEAGSSSLPGPMGDLMKNAMEQQVVGRLARMTTSLHLTPEQAQSAREILMRQAGVMSAGMQQVFSGKFDKDALAKLGKSGGNPEEQIKELLTADQKAAYQNYQQEEATYNARLIANNELIQLQSTLGLTTEQEDRAFAALYEVTFNQLQGNPTQKFASQAEQMQWTLDQKAKALESVLTASQLEAYHQQQAMQAKAMKDILDKMQGSSVAK